MKKNVSIILSSNPTEETNPSTFMGRIIDKTAWFVVKNGIEFERTILAQNENNPKFSFLKVTDPFYSYYQSKLIAFEQLVSRDSYEDSRYFLKNSNDLITPNCIEKNQKI